MAEPTILYSPDGERVVVYSPGEVKRLLEAGHSFAPPAPKPVVPKSAPAKGKASK